MARVLEDAAKDLLAQLGLVVPRHGVAAGVDEAVALAGSFGGGAVIKALAPVGRRGKAGAVRLVADADEARAAATALLGSDLRGYPVTRLLVEERIDIARELYLSLTIDRDSLSIAILASLEGGIEIEELARRRPEAIGRIQVDPVAGLSPWQARDVWARAGAAGPRLAPLAALTATLHAAFTCWDAAILEINPLALTPDGRLVACGAVLSLDDAALARHPDLAPLALAGSEKSWRPPTPLEQRALALNDAEPYRGSARYIELEGGDIGFLCGGGGGSLVLFDSLLAAGGHPANYSEFGGNPTETKVRGLAGIVLDKPGVRGLFVAHNITNNTQVDVVARGVVAALEERGLAGGHFPVVAREAGVNDEAGRAIFQKAGVTYYGEDCTLSEAARRMAETVVGSW